MKIALHTRAFCLGLALFMGVIAPGWTIFGHTCSAMGVHDISLHGPTNPKKKTNCCGNATDPDSNQKAGKAGTPASVQGNCCDETQHQLRVKGGYVNADSLRVKAPAEQTQQDKEQDQPLRANFEIDFLFKVYDFIVHLFDDSAQNTAGKSLILLYHKLRN